MANQITSKRWNPELSLDLSNMHFAAFIKVLALATSGLAESKREIELSIWLACRDQTLCGLGCASFDLAELPWSTEQAAFEKERAFLDRALVRAHSRVDWGELGYQNHRFLEDFFSAFLGMIREFSFQHVQAPGAAIFLPEDAGARCAEHGVLLHLLGCVICNDRQDLSRL